MAKHAKHAAPPRRRRSAQKHTSHKGVTLYTLGVLLVAVSALLSLRLWPRRIVDAVPPAAEAESPAVSEELVVPEPQPVVTTLRFSATGDNLILRPSIRRPTGGLQRAKDTASITATRICSISMHSRTSTGSIRRRSAAKSLRPLPTPASRLPASAPKRFTGQASGCSASRTITPTTRGLRALPPPSGSGRRCPRM